ncbi:VOC family protein [Phycisphaerales bacterium AB-hyl4]|uniref:VOC family protein n=1 Tax=Natronomicrosphaera hydrolytica TaxID=3242702 RepID=A0ABV4U2I6_9BACT
MENIQTITPCLWFDGQAEEAATFYTSVFKNSSIGHVTRVGEASAKVSGQVVGSVLAIDFQLDGRPFSAINGGPMFKFNEAISFQINCQTQNEVDYYWEKLSAVPEAERCGWLKDRFDVSWQVIPMVLFKMLADPDPEKSQRAMQAMLQMKKLDIDKLERAYAG